MLNSALKENSHLPTSQVLFCLYIMCHKESEKKYLISNDVQRHDPVTVSSQSRGSLPKFILHARHVPYSSRLTLKTGSFLLCPFIYSNPISIYFNFHLQCFAYITLDSSAFKI